MKSKFDYKKIPASNVHILRSGNLLSGIYPRDSKTEKKRVKYKYRVGEW